MFWMPFRTIIRVGLCATTDEEVKHANVVAA